MTHITISKYSILHIVYLHYDRLSFRRALIKFNKKVLEITRKSPKLQNFDCL